MHAELEFLLAWPPESSLADGSGNGENKQQPINLRGSLFIQGFIDCLYQDAAGDWRLLDYKTNLVSPDRHGRGLRNADAALRLGERSACCSVRPWKSCCIFSAATGNTGSPGTKPRGRWNWWTWQWDACQAELSRIEVQLPAMP